MGLREIRLQPRGVLQLGNRFFVPLLIREQNAELQESLCELAIERDGAPHQRFDLPQIRRRGRLPLPQAHGVVKLREPVSRIRLREPRETLGDLAARCGRDAVHLAEKLIGPRIRWREVGGATKRLDRILVLPT